MRNAPTRSSEQDARVARVANGLSTPVPTVRAGIRLLGGRHVFVMCSGCSRRLLVRASVQGCREAWAPNWLIALSRLPRLRVHAYSA